MVKTSKKTKKVTKTQIQEGNKKVKIIETTKTVETTVVDDKTAKKQAKIVSIYLLPLFTMLTQINYSKKQN